MAVAQAVTIGEQVRLRFVGWPKVKDKDGNLTPHPKEGQPFVPTWNSRPYPVQPGQDVFVPFEMAKVFFGDPRSLDNIIRIKDEYGNDMIIPDRLAEVRRLQNLWQNSTIKFREYIPGDRSFLDDGISDLMPIVEVYTLSNERIMMVSDDPYGETVTVAMPSVSEQNRQQQIMRDQSDLLVQLQKQNRLLLQKLGIREEDLASLNDPEVLPPTVPQDGSPTPPTTATKTEHPSMVFNPRTRRVEPKRLPREADPTTITELPVDVD